MKTINRKKIIILAITLFLCMIFIDEASVAITLPHIQRDFHLSFVMTQWVMNALFLPLSVLVLFGGKLSDLLGSRKTFTYGMLIFWVASLICTISPNGVVLIIGRVLQGVGASLLLATYAILISQVFSNNERGMALGSCASYAAIFLAFGPLLGGAIAHYLNWRVVFALNLPLAPFILALVYKSINKDVVDVRAKEAIDYKGLALFLFGFTALIFSLMQAVEYGWSSAIIQTLLVFSMILLGFFIWSALKSKAPIADLTLFKIKPFLAGNIILLCTQVVVMCLTYWAIWLQHSLGMSAIMAGIGLLPAGLPIFITGKLGGIWLDRYGPKRPIVFGSIVVLIGMLILAFTAYEQNYWLAFFGFLGYGIGAPFIISPAIATVLNSVPDQKKGMAAGMLNTMRQLGAALCFGVVGVVITNIMHVSANTMAKSSATVYSHAFSYGMLCASVFALVSLIAAIWGFKTNHH